MHTVNYLLEKLLSQKSHLVCADCLEGSFLERTCSSCVVSGSSSTEMLSSESSKCVSFSFSAIGSVFSVTVGADIDIDIFFDFDTLLVSTTFLPRRRGFEAEKCCFGVVRFLGCQNTVPSSRILTGDAGSVAVKKSL